MAPFASQLRTVSAQIPASFAACTQDTPSFLTRAITCSFISFGMTRNVPIDVFTSHPLYRKYLSVTCLFYWVPVIVYFRPRGVQGNYKLGVILGLLPTESATIYQLSYQQSKDIKPIETHPVHRADRLISTTYIYVITKFIPGQQLRILIQDQDVYYPQDEWYTADMNGLVNITAKRLEHHDFAQVLKNQELKKITLYDLDAMGLTPGQEMIVEAETDYIAGIRHLLLEPGDKGK